MIAIGLVRPKTHWNVGSVLRLADAFSVGAVIFEGARYKRASTDVSGAAHRVVTVHAEDVWGSHPAGTVPVGVELHDDADPLPLFSHPRNAFYIFGPEDGSLGRKHLSRCSRVVSIPAGCINLATAVACVLYDRAAKEMNR